MDATHELLTTAARLFGQKVLALIWHGPALLLGPACGDRSPLVGLRPFGGTIELRR